jgi:hypothetical protein
MVMEEIVGVLEMSDRIDAYPAEKALQGEYEKKAAAKKFRHDAD